jgi:hypothetical protein
MKTFNITRVYFHLNYSLISPSVQSDTAGTQSNIQSDAGGKVSIFGADGIGHYKKKKSSYDCVSNSEWLPR